MDQAKGKGEISHIKKQLRTEIIEQLELLSADYRRRGSQRLCTKILSCHEYARCSEILAFYPFRFEIDITPVLREIIKGEKRLFLPRIEGKQMEFREVYNLKQLRSNRWGIPEPPTDAPLWKENQDTLMLLPGTAFDEEGGRLGWGGGFYDRWLDSNGPDIYKMGLCFSQQLLKWVPRENHDKIMDRVLFP